MATKAQVTLFIILGGIILLAASLLFFVNTDVKEKAILTETPGEVQHAGQQELRSFMDSCIREALFNGLEIMRLQGGYIDIPPGAPIVQLQQDEKIIERNGIKKVELQPGAKNQVVYWLDSGNRLFIPSQPSMEAELAGYMKKSVLSCVDDFKSFREQQYQVSTGELAVEAEFSDEVIARVKYPITFSRGDVSFDESSFILRAPINIKKVIDLSTDATLTEYYGKFLEYDMKYLLSLYSYGGTDTPYDLPPMIFTDANADCGMQAWQLPEVKQLLINNFDSNLKYITLQGYGNNAGPETSEIAKGVYKGMTHEVAQGYSDA